MPKVAVTPRVPVLPMIPTLLMVLPMVSWLVVGLMTARLTLALPLLPLIPVGRLMLVRRPMLA